NRLRTALEDIWCKNSFLTSLDLPLVRKLCYYASILLQNSPCTYFRHAVPKILCGLRVQYKQSAELLVLYLSASAALYRNGTRRKCRSRYSSAHQTPSRQSCCPLLFCRRGYLAECHACP